MSKLQTAGIYDMASIMRHCEEPKTNMRKFKDAGDAGILLARHLTQVDPTIFEKLYPENAFLMSGLTNDTTGGYANTVQKVRLEGAGGFQKSTDRSNSNKGLITLSGEQDTINVEQLDASLQYNHTEMEQARLGNYNIVDRLFEVANRLYQQELDSILATGGGGTTTGLLNHSGFTTDTASEASTLTGEQQYEAIAELITDQWNGVNNTEGYMANTVMLPSDVYNILTTTVHLPNAGTKKVLASLMEAFPQVRFMNSWRGNSVSGTRTTVAYSTNRNSMLNRIPIPLMVGETIKTGSFEYKADLFFRIAGLDVAENSAGRILTGF